LGKKLYKMRNSGEYVKTSDKGTFDSVFPYLAFKQNIIKCVFHVTFDATAS